MKKPRSKGPKELHELGLTVSHMTQIEELRHRRNLKEAKDVPPDQELTKLTADLSKVTRTVTRPNESKRRRNINLEREKQWRNPFNES